MHGNVREWVYDNIMLTHISDAHQLINRARLLEPKGYCEVVVGMYQVIATSASRDQQDTNHSGSTTGWSLSSLLTTVTFCLLKRIFTPDENSRPRLLIVQTNSTIHCLEVLTTLPTAVSSPSITGFNR